MRYRQGSLPEELGPPVGQEITVGTAVFGLFLGAGLVIAGVRGRKLWVTGWGGMLAVASLVYLGAAGLGYT